MKKTLLIAAALACSGMVKAEIYSCTSTYGAAIDNDSLVRDGLPTRTWIADTRRGLRVSGENIAASDYSGNCDVIARIENASTTICTKSDLSIFRVIKIEKRTTGEITFKASNLDIFNFSYTGFCTEI